MRLSNTFASFVLLAVAVNAQTPNYTGNLLIEPWMNAGKCLTAASKTNGAKVTIQDCTGDTNQQWKFASGSVTIYGGSFCLDVPSGANVDGTKLQIWTCTKGSKNQQWYWTNNHLYWTDHNKSLDLPGGKLDNGNQVQIWTNSGGTNQKWNVGYHVNSLPTTSEKGQTGINNCGSSSSQSSKCQTAWINSAEDFCLWAPPSKGTIGDTERNEVAWCTKSGRGTRTIPNGSLKGVHFVKTKDYVQVTGAGDFTKINIPNKDEGGELDPHGADGNGNPIGGLVYGDSFGKGLQYHEWTSFISYNEFCFRACTGADAAKNCQHIYDVMGCYWNMPANYDAGVFENCKGDNDLPMGVYGTSTWHQGTKPTPSPHPAASSSSCTTLQTVSVSPLQKRGFEYLRRAPEPTHL